MDPRAYKYNEPANAVTETEDEWREERVVCCQVKTAMNLLLFTVTAATRTTYIKQESREVAFGQLAVDKLQHIRVLR